MCVGMVCGLRAPERDELSIDACPTIFMGLWEFGRKFSFAKPLVCEGVEFTTGGENSFLFERSQTGFGLNQMPVVSNVFQYPTSSQTAFKLLSEVSVTLRRATPFQTLTCDKV